MSDSSHFSLGSTLMLWKKEYGVLTKSKKWKAEYYQIPIDSRFQALKILVQRIKDENNDIEFFTNSRRDEIIESIIPHKKSVAPYSYDMFKKGTKSHLDMAIAEIYSGERNGSELSSNKDKNEEIAKKELPFTKIFDPSRFEGQDPPVEDIIDEEMAALLGLKDNE